MLAATMNNTNASESVADVLSRLNEQIRQFETDLAQGALTNASRTDLTSMLRQAKALRAALNIAVEGGDLSSNSLLFDNRGMPTAARGSFLYEILRKAEEETGLFSWRRGRRGRGPKGRGPKGRGPKGRGKEGGYGPQTPAPPIRRMTTAPTGDPGVAYPNLSGYVFGKDSLTAVQKVAGRPMPDKWPAAGTSNYFVYGDNLAAYQVVRGYIVPGTVKTYYDANPLDTNASMTYPDGVYPTALAIPPTATTVTSGQTSGNKLYIPTKGDAVSGRATFRHAGPGTGISSADATARAPFEFVVAANIPWDGSGTSHVFNTDGASLAKAAGVVVPGQASKVYDEGLSVINVAAGTFVPGSGVHSQGGAVRNKVYTGTNPATQLTWTAGNDTPWDVDATTRFNASGASATFAVGDAYPSQTNKVFDSDWSQFTKAAGKEVPGSPSYDRDHAETGDADGLGPAAQVYNASLNPVNKTRGNFVPGTSSSKVYDATGGGATIATPSPGDAVILSSGVSAGQFYLQPGGSGTALQPTNKAQGQFNPQTPTLFYELTDPNNPATAIARNPQTMVEGALGARTIGLRMIPGTMPGGTDGHWYYWDPGVTYIQGPGFQPLNPGQPGAPRVAAGQSPNIFVFLDAPFGAFADPSMRTRVQFAPSIDPGQLVDVATAAGGGLIAPEYAVTFRDPVDFNPLTVTSGGTETQGQFVTTTFAGTGLAGIGASTSTTTSSRSSGAYRSMMGDPRATSRWL